MRCSINSYNFSAFGDFRYFDSTPDSIYSLMDLFRNEKLIPSTFEEIGGIINLSNIQQMANIQQISNNVIPRPALNSFDKKTSIVLASDRLNFIFNSDTQYNKLSFNTTQNKRSEELAKKIFEHYSVKSNRFAINTEITLNDLSENESKLFFKLFNPLPFYKDAFNKEWHQRLTTRKIIKLESEEEEINIIFVIRQLQLMRLENNGKTHAENVILLNFDINTAQEKTSNRFHKNHIASFIKGSWGFQEEILKQIVEGVLIDI